MKIYFLALLVFLMCLQTWAGETLRLKGKELRLNGRGTRSFTLFNIKVFEASLYLEEATSDPKKIITSPQLKLLRLRFFRDISENRYREGSIDQFEKDCEGKACEVVRGKVIQAGSVMRDIKSGETVDYLFLNDRVEIAQMGEKRGEIIGLEYAKYVLNSWVGPNPQSEDLKVKLLGSR